MGGYMGNCPCAGNHQFEPFIEGILKWFESTSANTGRNRFLRPSNRVVSRWKWRNQITSRIKRRYQTATISVDSVPHKLHYDGFFLWKRIYAVQSIAHAELLRVSSTNGIYVPWRIDPYIYGLRIHDFDEQEARYRRSFVANTDNCTHLGYLILLVDENDYCNEYSHCGMNSKRLKHSNMAGKMFAFLMAFDQGFLIRHNIELI